MNGDGFLHHVLHKILLYITSTNPQKQKQVNEKVPSEDVLTDILIQLPAKQLARMRCVSKRWNWLLSQPYFIKSHLHRNLIRNKNKDNEILLVLTFSKDVLITAHPSRSPNIKLNDRIKLPANLPHSNAHWSVIGSVNGLICFNCGSNDLTSAVYIWNPSLSAVMRLPDFTWPSRSSGSFKSYDFIFRFGFDPKSDDYKVVKVIRCGPVFDLQVEVYSMRKGTWGLISESFPSKVCPFSLKTKVDGHDGHGNLYWLCWNHSDDHQTIVAFDLGAETFFEISLPGTVIKSKRFCKDLYFFTGKICVTLYNRHDNVNEVWVMNEYRVTESWVKHHVLSNFNWNIVDPVGFTSNNEVYFREHDRDRLALYDPYTTQVKCFDRCHVNKETRIVQYVDSLVWITPTN